MFCFSHILWKVDSVPINGVDDNSTALSKMTIIWTIHMAKQQELPYNRKNGGLEMKQAKHLD